MNRLARIRLAVATAALTVAYYYLLVYLVGRTAAQPRPAWWLALFQTRLIAAISWLVAMHTIAVLAAALPVAMAAFLFDRPRALWIGAIAAAIATMVAIVPALASPVWPLIWNSHPVFFVTDQIKLIGAVPLLIWAIRKVSSGNRFERARDAFV